ncbi:membrane protein [Streptomyces spiroverticillatus]|uniref:Membrane protein n=1 Tax=Streptomyces finlayi TaxID=67296 RepID=A0A918WSK8_9ACTN|nr:membrane protein [Streptomyces spiroverticillatus]GHC78617.1 membrane protein [Streptomyces finlayi]
MLAQFPAPLKGALCGALFVHLGVHLMGLGVLVPWARLKGRSPWGVLAASWDSRWYIGIAEHGYGTVREYAFFPLQPVLMRAMPGSAETAGLLLAVGASFAAVWGVFAVGEHLHGPRVGILLAGLWSAYPVGLVQWMGYTESLFTALAAWCLYAVLTGRWIVAASLACLAGLTRPTGIAVAAAVMAGALGSGRRRAFLAGVLAPAGWVAYVGWVGVRQGRWDGYFAVQRRWRNTWDGGADTLREMRGLLAYEIRPPLFLVVVTGVMLAAVVLFVWCAAVERQPLPLLVFSGVLLVIVLGADGVYFPRARFLLPAFPLLLPIALAVGRARARGPAAVLVVGGAALFAAYFGAYMALVWPSAP